jgi:glutamine amidotransferase
VVKFTSKVKSATNGWNQIIIWNLFKGISEKEYMYLVHSFMQIALIPLLPQIMKNMPQHWRKIIYGTQFHPEKSGDGCEQILGNF